jgi:hypothetical protein
VTLRSVADISEYVHEQESLVPKALMVGIAAALAALAASTVFAAGPAQAATPAPRSHVVAVAGSNRYLVYETARSSKDIQAGNRNKGTLYARNAKGTVSRLTHFADGVGVVEQTGHVLVEKTFANVTVDGVTTGVQRVRQRDLVTGTESLVTLAPSDSMASVAPDGYLVRHDVGDGDGGSVAGTTSLTYRHVDGSTAALAVPFPGGLDYALRASDTVLLATSPSSDEQTRASRVAYMTWANPGVWHPVYNAGRPRDISCAAPSSTHVACRVDGIDTAGPGLVLLRLKDGHATWLHTTHPKACSAVSLATRGTNLWALETSDAGVCTKGKLYRLQADGKLVGGSTRYLFNALGDIHSAYGKVVLSGGDQRHLYTTTGVTKKPVIIVKA